MMTELTIPAEFGEELVLTCWRNTESGQMVARLSIRAIDDDDFRDEVDIAAAELMPLVLALASIADKGSRRTAADMTPAEFVAMAGAAASTDKGTNR